MHQLARRHVQPLAGSWPAHLEELARRLGLRRSVRLLESATINTPLAMGWLKPTVLLPASALSGLAPEALEALLAHELAHIRRHDYLVNMLQTAVETLLFYHPAVWWVSHRMRVEREFCCDDLAARTCGSPVTYARALAEMEALRVVVPRPALAANGGSLLERVARLVGRPLPSRRAPAWLSGLMVFSLLAILGCITQLPGRNAQGGPVQNEQALDKSITPEAQARAGKDLTLTHRADDKTSASQIAATFQKLAHSNDVYHHVSPLASLIKMGRDGGSAAEQVLPPGRALVQDRSQSAFTRAQTWILLGALHDEQSIALYTKVLVSEPSETVRSAAALAMGEMANPAARQALEAARGREQSSVVRASISAALAGRYRGRLDEVFTSEAQTAFHQASNRANTAVPNESKDPAKADAQQNLHCVEVWAAYLKQYPLSPYTVSAMSLLASGGYTRLKRFGEAKQLLNEAIRLARPDRSANMLEIDLAYVEKEAGELDAAEARLKRVMTLPPPASFADPYTYTPQLFIAPEHLAKLYRARGQDEKADALMDGIADTAERLVREHPEQAEIISSYASLTYLYRIESLWRKEPGNKKGMQTLVDEFGKRFPKADEMSVIGLMSFVESPLVPQNARGKAMDNNTSDTAFPGKIAQSTLVQNEKARYQPITPETQPTSDIPGIVVDENGKPIPDVTVQAFPSGQPQAQRRTVRSGADGRFLFPGLAPKGYWCFSVENPHFAWMWDHEDGHMIPAKAEDLPVSITLYRPRTMNGTVVDEGGKPVAGVRVVLVNEWLPGQRYPINGHLDTDMQVATTGAAGAFQLTRLRPGRVSLVLEHPDYAITFLKPLDVTGAPARLTIEKGLTLRGRVTAQGKPLAGATVTVGMNIALRPVVKQKCKTDARGEFAVPRIYTQDPKDYGVSPTVGASIEDPAWYSDYYTIYQAEKNSLPFVAIEAHPLKEGSQPQRAHVDIGKRDAAAGLASKTGKTGAVLVSLKPATLGTYFLTSIEETEKPISRTQNGGKAPVSFGNLPAGRYQIAFLPQVMSGPGYPPQVVDLKEGQSLSVLLTPGPSGVSGMVRCQGKPVGGGHISWYPENGSPSGIYKGGLQLPPDGRFSFEGLKPGRYCLLYEDRSGGMPNTLAIELKDTTTTVDFVLPANRIEGQLEGVKLPPAKGRGGLGEIFVRKRGVSPMNGNEGAWINADADGRFTIRYVPPGVYTITGYGCESSTNFRGDNSIVQLTLKPPAQTGVITGTVSGPLPTANDSFSEVWVSAFAWDDQAGYDVGVWHQGTVNKRTGQYSIRDMPVGYYGVLLSGYPTKSVPCLWVSRVEVKAGLARQLDLAIPKFRQVNLKFPYVINSDPTSARIRRWQLRMPTGEWLDHTLFSGSNPSNGQIALPLGDYDLAAGFGPAGRASVHFTVEPGEGTQTIRIDPPRGQNSLHGAEGKGALALHLLGPDGSPWTARAGAVLLRLSDQEMRPDFKGWNGIRDDVYWRDPQNGRAWICKQSMFGLLTQKQFDNLELGTYRVAATGLYPGRLSEVGPIGLSEPVQVRPAKAAEATVRLQAGAPLTLQVNDALTGKGLDQVWLSLIGPDGLPVCRGMISCKPDQNGRMEFKALPPGKYLLTSVNRPNREFNDIPYKARVNVPVEVKAGQSNRLEITLERRTQTKDEVDGAWPFIVEGRITDEAGRPLAGVTVKAPWDHGLGDTAVTTSGLDGRYCIRIPSIIGSPSETHSLNQPSPLTIRVQKEGYQEKGDGETGKIEVPKIFFYYGKIDPSSKGLIKPGGPMLKKTMPEQGGPKLIQPGKPHTINFIMAPAAGHGRRQAPLTDQ